MEDSESDDDGYKNLKLKTSTLENNIRSDCGITQIQAELDANLQVSPFNIKLIQCWSVEDIEQQSILIF